MINKIYVTLLVGLFLCGCATSQGISTTLSDDELSLKIKASPIVRVNTKLPKISDENNVEIHYLKFHSLNSPNRIINWEYYYKIGEFTEPKWDYKEVGNIEFWVADKDDDKNITIIKHEVSKYGADAVIDLFRKPINTSSQNAPPYGPHTISEFGIGGYLYYGKLIIRR